MSNTPPPLPDPDRDPATMTPDELRTAWAQYQTRIDFRPRSISRKQMEHAWAVAVALQRYDDAKRDAGHQPEGLSL